MNITLKITCFCICLVVSTHVISQSGKFQQLVWSDEFNYKGLPDARKWGYDTGRGCPRNCGWGNNELQYYTVAKKENARVENGMLVIEARKEKVEEAQYTSARLVTKYKGDWVNGRIEVRAKLPSGKGVWPAVWMLPTDWTYGGWPKSGEIDIMEFVGYLPDSVFGSIHTGTYNWPSNTQKTKGVFLNDLANAFHVYGIEWDRESITFTIDGKAYLHFSNEYKSAMEWPFDQRFHLILNIAVGGNWGGKYGVDDGIFPQRMLVDYVRVYQ